MAKYIIDVVDIGNGLYRAKGFNTLVFDDNGLSRLEKYKDEKPHEYWFIDSLGEIRKVTYDPVGFKARKAIGNVFATKGEAKASVEKLKDIAKLRNDLEAVAAMNENK